MTGKQIFTGTILTMGLLAGCSGKHVSGQEMRIVLMDMSVSEQQQFQTQELQGYTGQVEILTGNEASAVDMLRKGEADCGYGAISADNAIHYGILKSDVVKRKEMLLVSEKRILNSDELEDLVVGYLDDLDEDFIGYLKSISSMELHAYLSEEQLKKDLRSGLLDLAAAEEQAAFRILEAAPDSWQISQPSDLPVLEYRFFACTQEALDLAAVFRKGN